MKYLAASLVLICYSLIAVAVYFFRRRSVFGGHSRRKELGLDELQKRGFALYGSDFPEILQIATNAWHDRAIAAKTW